MMVGLVDLQVHWLTYTSQLDTTWALMSVFVSLGLSAWTEKKVRVLLPVF